MQLELPWYSRIPVVTIIAVALMALAIILFLRPVHPTLVFDGKPDRTVSFSKQGPTRLMLRMTDGANVEIVSVTPDPAGSVRVLEQPGACTPGRTLTSNLPVCALWIEPGGAAEKRSKVRVAYRLPGDPGTSEVVLRVR